MGLLGTSWDDPQSQGIMALAGGLLSGDFGQGVRDYGTVMAGAKDKQMQRDFQTAQMDNYRSEIAQRNAAVKKQAMLQDFLQQKMGGGNPSDAPSNGPFPAPDFSAPVSGGLLGPDLPPTSAPPAPMPGPIPGAPAPQGGMGGAPGRGGLSGMSLEDVTRLHALGGPDLTATWKLANEGFKQEPGAMYRMPNGQYQFGPPALDKNMQALPDGRGGWVAGVVPGATGAVGDLTRATELAKAQYDMVAVPMGDGTTQMMPRAQAAQIMSGQQPSQGQQPSGPAPVVRAGTPQPGVVGSGYWGGTRDGANEESIRVMENELKDITMPVDQRAGILREIQRLKAQSGLAKMTPASQANAPTAAPAPSQTQFGRTQTPQDAATQTQDNARKIATIETGAKAGADRIFAGYDQAQASSDHLISIGEARKSMAGGVFAGAGAETRRSIAKVLGAMGFPVDENKIGDTEYLQSTLGQGVLNKIKILGGNPSDGDVRLMHTIVGSIGLDPNGLNKFLDFQEMMANRSIERHNKNYANAVKGGFNAGWDLTVGTPKAPAPGNAPAAAPAPAPAPPPSTSLTTSILDSLATSSKKPGKTVVQTGLYGGKRVNKYSDGSVDYAN